MTTALAASPASSTRRVPCRNPGVVPSTGQFVPCGSQDSEVCPGCGAAFLKLVYLMVRFGLFGTCWMWTVTGPSFGQIHSLRLLGNRIRVCHCGAKHSKGQAVLGTPLNWRRYDYLGQAMWNRMSGRLVAIALQKVRRLMERHYGITIEWVMVAEVQARGAVHYHVFVRGLIPAWVFDVVVRGGVNPVTDRSIPPTSHNGYLLGRQFDVSAIDLSRAEEAAAYGAKYVSKGRPGLAPVLDPVVEHHQRRLADAVRQVVACGCAGRVHEDGSPVIVRHARGMPRMAVVRTWAWDRCPEVRRALRLCGSTGRIVTASRGWGVTLGQLRQNQRDWAALNLPPQPGWGWADRRSQ